MRRPSILLLAAGLAASIAMVPTADPLPEGCRTVDVAGTPEDASDDITLCEEQLFVRSGAAPVSNVTSAVFSAEAPSGAPIGGAGLGGSVTDIAAQGDPAHGLEVNGTFTGAVDTIDVEVHLLMPRGATGGHGTTPAIELNGFDVAGALVDATVEPGALPGTAVARFRVDDVLSLWDALGFSYDADAEHTIRLNLSPFYIGDDGAYLYDGTEVPSNVVLNAAG